MEWETQYSSVPSTPNSFSSQSTGGGNPARTDKVPSLKQLSPSPSVIGLSKLPDEDLRRKGKEDLLGMLRGVETDYKTLLADHGNVVKDVNRRYQIFVLESKNLKEGNEKLQDDNQELRDLCCFLDDDRQRGRKLAREWQRFGRYTASVMRSEVAVYQEKLRELEQRQSELVTENMELKELCLFLDQERTRISGDRDEGDGSSNGTAVQEDGIVSSEGNAHTTNNLHSTGSSNYLRELEQKVEKLEEEKRILAQRVNRNNADGLDRSQSVSNDTTLVHESTTSSRVGEESCYGLDPSGRNKLPGPDKPDAVVHAMKVLQVHEELEKTPTQGETWDDREKAILREMCNVVWRKLGDVGDVGSFNDSSDSILTSPSSRPPHPDTSHGAQQGKAQSFHLPQPQPQMSSTPITSPPKARSEPSQMRMSPTKSFQMSHVSHHNQPQIQKVFLPQADQRVDMYAGEIKDHATANFRPGSPMKKHEPDHAMHGELLDKQNKSHQAPPSSQPSTTHQQQSQVQDYPYSGLPSKNYQFAEDEKLPPHFLPHRRQLPQTQLPASKQLQQPLPYNTNPPQQLPQYPGPAHQSQRPPLSKSSQQLPTPYYPLHSNNHQGKTPTPSSQDQQSQFQMPKSSSSSSAPAASISNRNSNLYQNQQELYSSQPNPQHHIRLLDAPGVHQPKYETRSAPREDTYSSQQFRKPNHPHQIMPPRREEFRSESNVSKAGLIGNTLQNQNNDPRSIIDSGHRPQQDRFSSGYPSNSSSYHQGPQSLPPQSNHPHEDYKPAHHPPTVHNPSGFSAYPPPSMSRGQQHPHPVHRALHPAPVPAKPQPRPTDDGPRKAPHTHYPGRNQYNDYDSDSL